MIEKPQNDLTMLTRLITLEPAPATATWSVTTTGTDDGFGPTDETLWAVASYSHSDLAQVSRMFEIGSFEGSVPVTGAPEWLVEEANLNRFRKGSRFEFGELPSAETPFYSQLYTQGFAVLLPDGRVLMIYNTT